MEDTIQHVAYLLKNGHVIERQRRAEKMVQSKETKDKAP